MDQLPPLSENHLLARLGADERDRVAAHASLEPLEKGVDIGHPGEAIEYCWFPLSGLVSIIAMDLDGGEAEVGIIGCDGCVNAAVVIGETQSEMRLLVQIGGEALRIEAGIVQTLARSSPQLAHLLHCYVQAFSIQVASSALAFARYPIAKRLARWLLMASDRVEGDLPLVHDALAIMLGVRRAGVTEAVQALQRRGAIHAYRGRIAITSRELLLDAASSGYGAPEAAYARLMEGYTGSM